MSSANWLDFSGRGLGYVGRRKPNSLAGCTAVKSRAYFAARIRLLEICYLVSESPAPVCSSAQPAQPSQLQLDLTTQTKQCYACRKVLPVEAFSRHVVHGEEYRNRRCSACRARREKGSALVNKKRQLADKAKSGPCADCNTSFPAVCMDFDHVHGDKLYNIGSACRWVSMAALIAEIAKCDVVCANCHRIRTANRPHQRPGRPSRFLAKVGRETVEVSAGVGSERLDTDGRT